MSLPSPVPRVHFLGALVLVLALAACSGGGSSGGGTDGSTAAAGSTGSVGVLLTDGPSDEFLQILLRVTKVELLGDAGRATLFEDPAGRVFDLLSLRDDARVLGVGSRVPVGDWQKIRLQVEDVELIRLVDENDVTGDEVDCPDEVDPEPGCVCESIEPHMGGHGKLDLNPRGTIPVRAGELLLVQLDLDANKSIHIHETGGKHRYVFRPVVFVDVFTRKAPDRLVLIEGTVGRVDVDEGRFELCDTHPIHHASHHGDDDGPDDERCVLAFVGPDTSIFDRDGVLVGLAEVETGDTAAVLGRFRLDRGEELRFDAEVVQLGGRQAVIGVRGVVLGPVEEIEGELEFPIEPDADGPIAVDELWVRLIAGAKLFDRSGRPLDPDDIAPNQRVQAYGWRVPAAGDPDRLDASVVFLSPDESGRATIRGVVAEPYDESRLELTIVPTDPDHAEPSCVSVFPGADVFRIVEEAGMLRSEKIEPEELEVGEIVDVFGWAGAVYRCYVAETVISVGFSE